MLSVFRRTRFIWFLIIEISIILSNWITVQAQSFAPQISCAQVTEISAGECEALLDLYNAAGGDSWTNNTNWFSQGYPDPSTWYGVTVSASHVVMLFLRNNNLVGALPASLKNLTYLTELNLAENSLSGEIPDLSAMAGLTNLYLHKNNLSGTIPAYLNDLTELKYIDLSINSLSGEIPALGNLSRLTHLYLRENNLTGSIPTVLGNLQTLVYLDLSYNQLTGSIPAGLGALPNLLTLYLSNNQLAETIPDLTGSPKLKNLNLSYNRLVGGISTQFAALTDLQWLILYDNQLTGAIPDSMGALTKLTRIELQNNHLSGVLPDLQAVSNLKVLVLANNTQLVDSIPLSYTSLTQLSTFLFSGTNLCEPYDEEFTAWKNAIPTWQSTGILCDFPDGFEIQGKISDQSGNPLQGVTISAVGTDANVVPVVSQADGSYTVHVGKYGVYQLTPSRTGRQFYPQTLTVQVYRDRYEQNFQARTATCFSPGNSAGLPCANATAAPFLQLPVRIDSTETTDRALQDIDFPGGLIVSWFDHDASVDSPHDAIVLHDGENYSGSLSASLMNGVACFNRHCSFNQMGIGITAPAGDSPANIYPAADGTITEICDPGIRGACNRGATLGRYVVIQHAGNRYATLYAHLAGLANSIAPNSPVTTADVIGSMGGSGGQPLQQDYWPVQLYFIVFFNGTNANPWTPDSAEAVDPFGWQPYDERLDDWKMPSVQLWSGLHGTPSEAPDSDSTVLSSDGVTVTLPASALAQGQIMTLADSTQGTLLATDLRSMTRAFHIKVFDSKTGWNTVDDFNLPVSVQVNYSQADLSHLDAAQISLYRLVSQTWTPVATTLQDDVATATIDFSGKFTLAAPLLCPQDTKEPYNDGPDVYKHELTWNYGTVLEGFFDSASDQDWIRIEMIAGVHYTFSTQHGPNSDSILTLLGSDGVTVLASDDPSDRNTAQIEWTPETTDVYYLRVAQAEGSLSNCEPYQVLQSNSLRYLYVPAVLNEHP